MNKGIGSRAGRLGTALFYGSVWGLAEATLGHLLHMARIPGLPGLIMFPFAVLVMGRAAARSGSAGVVFLTGVIAAGFKALDLLPPGTDILAVINPARAILLEALAAAVWVALREEGMFPFFLGSSPFSGNPLEVARDDASIIPVRGGGTGGERSPRSDHQHQPRSDSEGLC